MKRKLLNSIAVVSASAMIFCAFSPAVIADDEVMSDEDVAVQETEEDIDIEVEEADEEIVAEDVITEDEDAEEVLAADFSIDQAWVTARGGKLFSDTDVSGTYEISEDITVSAGSILVGVDITIDLNGYTVSYTGSESLIKVGYVDASNVNSIKKNTADHSTLTINDSSSAGTGKFFADVANGYTGGGSFTYSNAQYDGRGGCILVEQYSTLTMNGGTIDGFMSFGTIKDSEGGGIEINNNGKFYFKGGTVTNCSSPSGGGISINKYCTFEMTGGSIINNTASERGGGLRINAKNTTVRLYGGTITGNNCTTTNASDATVGGGGVYCYSCTPYIKGTLNIEGNTCAVPEKDDIYLHSCGPITLDGALDAASKIAFFSSKTGATDVMVNTNGKSYDIDSFLCNNVGYYPVASGNSIYIAVSIQPEIEGYNVSIGGAVLLEVTADLGTFANTNTYAHYMYSYNKNGTDKELEGTIPFSDMELVSGTVYKFSVPVESACMTSEINVHVHYGTNGENHSVFTHVTIEDYANEIINDPDMNSDIVAAARALLIYGGYAQINFGINTDNLPEIYGGYDFTAAPTSSLASNAYSCGVSAYSAANMVFLSQNSLKFRFTEDMGTITVNGTSVDGVRSGSYYVYEYAGADGKGIPATAYATPLTVVTSDGTFTYSVETYLQAVLASSTTSTNMKNLAMAYFNFAEAVSGLQ